MNALEASNKLKELDERIEALNVAYVDLWDDFDKRLYAFKINELKMELEKERVFIIDKLRSVGI